MYISFIDLKCQGRIQKIRDILYFHLFFLGVILRFDLGNTRKEQHEREFYLNIYCYYCCFMCIG